MTKLSFIVPVYNVEKYLRKCVFSLVHQDFRGYEIILVDDGSTDGSGAICDELSEMISDERLVIRVIHQTNRGLSAARNAGLKAAKGEYVCFVDSDDFWEENVLGRLMAKIEHEQLDVLRFDYQNVNERYEVFEPNKDVKYIDKKNEVVDGDSYLNTRMGYACYAVMFIMRRDVVPAFTEGIHFEDVDWLPRLMLAAKRVNSSTTVVYNYLVRQGSITQSQGDKNKIRKNIVDRMNIICRYGEYIECYPDSQWLKNMRSRMVAGILTDAAIHFYAQRNEYINRLRELKVFPLTIADQGYTYKRRARIINYFGPHIFCAIMHLR